MVELSGFAVEAMTLQVQAYPGAESLAPRFPRRLARSFTVTVADLWTLGTLGSTRATCTLLEML